MVGMNKKFEVQSFITMPKLSNEVLYTSERNRQLFMHWRSPHRCIITSYFQMRSLVWKLLSCGSHSLQMSCLFNFENSWQIFVMCHDFKFWSNNWPRGFCQLVLAVPAKLIFLPGVFRSSHVTSVFPPIQMEISSPLHESTLKFRVWQQILWNEASLRELDTMLAKSIGWSTPVQIVSFSLASSDPNRWLINLTISKLSNCFLSLFYSLKS